MRDWPRTAAIGLAALQVVDTAGNALVPAPMLTRHLDHLGVPRRLRGALPVIKVASAAGLLVGMKWRRLGAVTAMCTVAYYAAAAGLHLRAGDHSLVALPATSFGGAAVVALVNYLPL